MRTSSTVSKRGALGYKLVRTSCELVRMGFGRILNEVELINNWLKLTTDWLGLPGNGEFTPTELDRN